MIDHEAITSVMYSKGHAPGDPCIGVLPNPYHHYATEWNRRKANKAAIDAITQKIEMIYEPRFITFPETSELIESLATMVDAKSLLEIGVYSGFTSLHMLRAIIGKPGAKLTCVDARPAHDKEFFADPRFSDHYQFVEGWTPQILYTLKPQKFDFVFIDSDHSVEHCIKEREALVEITDPGCIWIFHDVPKWGTPDRRSQNPVSDWLDSLVAGGFLKGLNLPSPQQPDCLETYGAGYPKECNPGLGIYLRT